jgi:SAM-dependent methyltransferase
MPRVECGDYLEMCAGTGIAALLAAKHFAAHAYSADITERSTRFARFNAALNDLANFTAVEGDLYEPVAGKMFDIITAHPPYVPAESTEMVFRDGGADGEQITRRIIAGLPEHLRPGGLFYLDCAMTDRGADPVEERVRRMLGPEEEEFDVVVFRSGLIDAKVYQAGELAAGRMSPAAFTRQKEFFKRVGISRLVGVHVMIQRRVAPRSVVTRHHTLADATRAEDLLWFVRYSSATVEWGADEIQRLLDTPLRALPQMELRVRSALEDGRWRPVATVIGTTRPFAVETQCPTWFPDLLARCDGRTTAREHLTRLRGEGAVPTSTSDEDFAQLIRELADVPLVELHDFPLPDSPPNESSRFA